MNIIGEDTLMAYVDGELGALRREEVERALAGDPELRARVERERSLRERIAGHYAPVADEPVPERFEALVTRANVVDFAAARARQARPAWQALTALAATLVLGLALGTMLPGDGDGPVGFADGSLVARGELAEALEARLASEPQAAGPRIGLSFASADGRYCRTFDSSRLSGLACRGGEGWEVVAAAAAGSPAGGGEFRQASSAGNPLVLAAAQEMMAGEPFDAEAERRARDLRWRNPQRRD
jgi:hypothetical protein